MVKKILAVALLATALEALTNKQYKELYEKHKTEQREENERKEREKRARLEEKSEPAVPKPVAEKKIDEDDKDLKYGDQWVVEPGGTMLMSYSVTDKPAGTSVNASLFQIGFNPSINWFVADQFFLLFSPTLSYANATTSTGATSSSVNLSGTGAALGLGGVFHLAPGVFPYLEASGNYVFYSGSVSAGGATSTGTGHSFAANFGAGLKVGVLANGLFKVGFQLTRNFAIESGDLGSTSFYLLSGYSLWF